MLINVVIGNNYFLFWLWEINVSYLCRIKVNQSIKNSKLKDRKYEVKSNRNRITVGYYQWYSW